MSRMWGQVGSLAGAGFMSTYRSIGDLFDSNDNYLLKNRLTVSRRV
ncbi:MAG: hypothetical protein CM15mV42_0980 [uncultured marine virus]|nr:MAG: hypothetical protein CM15mV42_0980 [uncultured marine virus]